MRFNNALLATLSISLPVALAQRVFPASISLLNTTYAGTGCPANSIISTFDSSLLSLQFNATRYNVSLGKDISAVQNRKICQLRAEILVPANYSISIWQNHVSGTANLSEGVNAQFLTTLYLTSSVDQSNSFKSILKGPLDAPFAKTEDIPFETVWTPCRAGVATFNFNTQAKLVLLTGAASNATGAIEPTLSQSFDFMWQKC